VTIVHRSSRARVIMKSQASNPATSRRRARLSRRLLALSLAAGVLTPTTVSAHVKWFTDEDNYPLRTDLIVSDRTLLMVVTAVAAVCALIMLERMLRDTNWPNLAIFQRMAVSAPTILAVQAAITLVAAASQGTLLVPNFVMPSGPIGIVAIATEIFVAVTFVTGIFDWVGALALIAILPMAALVCGPWDVLEQGMWLGIPAVVLIMQRNPTSGWQARQWFGRRDPAWTSRAVSVLRVSTGIAFIAVACGEKLWNPDLGRAFVLTHPMFNFPQALGMSWFSDDMFVLMIGLTEATIGALLISGRLTRVVVLAMWLPFHLGIPLLPSQELIGHLPIFAVMYVLLVQPASVPSVAVAPRAVEPIPVARLRPMMALRGLALSVTRMH
jgi:hypothetical protein